MNGKALFSTVAHLLPPTFLFVASVVLVGIINGHDMLKDLNRVTLYTYHKASVNRDKALEIHDTKGEFAWLGDVGDVDHCLDMSTLKYPRVSFIPGDDPLGPSCQIFFEARADAADPQAIVITPTYTQQGVSGCRDGSFPIAVSGGAPGDMRTGTVTIARATPADRVVWTVTVTGVSLPSSGYTLAQQAQWATCLRRRIALAQQYLNHTSCQQESSQLCTCVAAFAGKVANPDHVLKPTLAAKNGLQALLVLGVDRCLQLRRAHDVREPAGQPYVRTDALLYFAVALLLNALHHVLMLFQVDPRWRVGAHLTWLLLLLVLISGGEVAVALTLLLASVPLLLYELFAYSNLPEEGRVDGGFYLHPVAFDVCLCALSLFTLVERGVVQREYLLVEILKCHAVAAIYGAATWLHRHMLREGTDDGRIFFTADVEYAYRLLYMVALAGSADTLLIPYPAKSEFSLHWLLPLAFTYFSLSNPSIARPLLARLKDPVHAPEAKMHGSEGGPHYNHLSSLLCLGVGFVVWGYLVLDYLRAYGAIHFFYPSYLYPWPRALPLAVRSP